MKIFFRLFFIFVMGGIPALSASLLVSPQDPNFVDGFNDQQKKAIFRFLNQELGKTATNENNAVVNDADLKQLYQQNIERWKAGITFSKKRRNQKKNHQEFIRQKQMQGSNDLAAILLKNFEGNRSKLNGSNAITITKKDIGTKGLLIEKPGYYRLITKKGVLRWDPSRIADLITIDADDVILDLNDTTIIQKGSNSFASTAVNILPGHKNILIRNGALVGFTADAILGKSVDNLFIEHLLINNNKNRQAYVPGVFFASVNIQSSVDTVLRNITVSNTVVNSHSDVLGAGILILDTQTFLIEDCRIVEAKVEAGTLSQCLGISTILSNDGVIENCHVSKCQSSGIMPAFGYVASQNILSENCIASYNTGVQTTSGYYPQLSDSLKFVNCEANSNHSTCQDCHGFPYFISSNGFFLHCRAANNIAINPSGKFNEKVTGFEILVCKNCIIEHCEAYNNTATNPIRHYAAGFANGNSTNVVFRDCNSIGNNAIGNVSRGVGFGPALDPRFFGPSTGTVWENCVAEGNFGDAQSIGFDLFGQIGAILTESISQNHGSVAVNNGIGILSNGPYDEGNPVDVPCDVVPIVMMTANSENNVVVKDNTVANNSFAGIMDTTGADNVYINNTVFNNGANFVGNIFADGTPIRNWTIGSAPSNANNNGVVGDKLDNVNILP